MLALEFCNLLMLLRMGQPLSSPKNVRLVKETELMASRKEGG